MRRYMTFLATLLLAGVAHADSPSATERTEIIGSVIAQLNASYIDAGQAGKLAPILRHGDFSRARTDEAFAKAVTDLMQDVTKDQHLRLYYSAKEIVAQANRTPTAAEIAERQAEVRAHNYGIDRVERLPRNIGYFKTSFFPTAGELAPSLAAAMTLLAYTDALIVDLRDHGGGDADAVPLVASYLFDERTRLGDLYTREGNVIDQQWTSPAVAGARFGGTKAVYVLTDKNTFSAGEGLAYALKNLKRATIVGETTRGAAHPARFKRLNAHYELMVPVAAVRDAVTGTDWEGVGVAPDLPVPGDRALTVAQTVILKKSLESQPDEKSREEIRKRLAELVPGIENHKEK